LKAIQNSWMHMHKIAWIVSLGGGGDESSCIRVAKRDIPWLWTCYGHAMDVMAFNKS
jgi:hypothetical protein